MPACIAALVPLLHARWRPSALALAAGVLCGTLRGHPPEIRVAIPAVRVAGAVTGDVVRTDDGSSFPFTLAGGTIVRALVRGSAAPGERLVIRGRLEPLDEARNPGEPSPRALALTEGIGGTLSGDVVARASPDGADVHTWSARARAWLGTRLRTVVREPEAGILAGALWGERDDVAATTRAAFQETGTVHVLVTAGLHLGVVAALLLGLFALAGVPRAPAAFACIAALIAYAWLSGAHLPSERAAVMIGMALLARALGARAASWNAIALAAIAVAVLRPVSVASASFALSFSCVAAIACFARPIDDMLARVRITQRAREALALTAATQIGVWPLSAAIFGTIAPYALLANALVIPAISCAMTAGFAAILCADIPAIGMGLGSAAALAANCVLRIVAIVSALPGAQMTVTPPPSWMIVAYDGAAIAAASLLRRSPRAACALLALASIAVIGSTSRFPDHHLTITVLDVGQGDGIVVRTPVGRTILIDTGGRLERGPSHAGESPAERAGERIVLGYLRRAGVRDIALMVLTHPHGDHAGGCAPIVNALHVDEILDSGQQYGGRAYTDCLAAARRRRVPVRIAARGQRWQSGDGVTLDVLAPSPPALADTGDDVNENSIVLRLTFHAHNAQTFRALFTGDAGMASEARMLAEGVDLHADLLKVGHHGSRYSSTDAFLDAVQPRDALISVGRHNTFGHPSPETIVRLLQRGVRVLRTDTCGAITVTPESGPTTAIACVRPLP